MRDAAPPAPAPISVAFALWVAVIALGLIGAVLLMLFGGPARTSTSGGSLVNPRGADFAAGVFAILLALVQLVVARTMRDGRRWSRTVLVVVTVLQVLGALSGGGGTSVLTWAAVVCAAVACLLMFLPASSAFFDRYER